jgi:hypothetical protein
MGRRKILTVDLHRTADGHGTVLLFRIYQDAASINQRVEYARLRKRLKPGRLNGKA